MRRYAGICMGGPLDGTLLESEWSKCVIPILPSLDLNDRHPQHRTKIQQGCYVHHKLLRAWIWQNEWPMKEKKHG